MQKTMKSRSKKVGLPPGSLVHIGEKKTEKTTIRAFDYDTEHLEEREILNIEDCRPFKETPSVTWVNVCGLHELTVMEQLGDVFGLHLLVQEDIVNTDHRPKLEDYDDYIFIVLKLLDYDQVSGEILVDQISLVLGSDFVLSVQEKDHNVFHPIEERLRKNKGRIRGLGPDYLLYALIDVVVDHYFLVLERVGESIDLLEDLVVRKPKPETLHAVHHLRREMLYARKSIWPLREVVGSLSKREISLVQDSTEVYFRDIYDHVTQMIDTVETFRDMLSGMLDIYLSSISNQTNEVMKVLTMFATIFIPLTFVVGVYGMNFKFMPELDWRWGYPLLWVVMLAISVAILAFFRRKKWL